MGIDCTIICAMIEQRKELPVAIDFFEEKTSGSRNPREFLDFLRQNVSIEMLLVDRHAQARLAQLLPTFHRGETIRFTNLYTGEIYEEPNLLPIPYPVVILVRVEDGQWKETSFMNRAFMLKDRQFYYYFPDWYPGDPVPPYLRPEDVVPSGTTRTIYTNHEECLTALEKLGITEDEYILRLYFGDDPLAGINRSTRTEDIPFNKPICRVSTNGGASQRYNYHTLSWEEDGIGVYTPEIPFTDRVKDWVADKVRKLHPKRFANPKLLK